MRSRSSGSLPAIRRWRPSASASRRCGASSGSGCRAKPRRRGLRAGSKPPSACARAHPSSHPSWRALAASVVLAALVASGATWFVLRPGKTDAVADMVVASHMRALMASQSTDVSLVRPPHRQAVVQRPHRRGSARGRSRQRRLSPGRRPHRRDRPRAGADAGLSPSPASDQPQRRSGVGSAMPRHARPDRRLQHRCPGPTTASPIGRSPTSRRPISRPSQRRSAPPVRSRTWSRARRLRQQARHRLRPRRCPEKPWPRARCRRRAGDP